MRNRFTIDTDIVFDGDVEQDLASPQEPEPSRQQQQQQEDNGPEQQQQHQSEMGGDTDRWVEEQFDLEEYEEQEEVKETDILSDDDDDELRRTPAVASPEAELEAPVMALSLEAEEAEQSESPASPASDAEKRGGAMEELPEEDKVWVRRE